MYIASKQRGTLAGETAISSVEGAVQVSYETPDCAFCHLVARPNPRRHAVNWHAALARSGERQSSSRLVEGHNIFARTHAMGHGGAATVPHQLSVKTCVAAPTCVEAAMII